MIAGGTPGRGRSGSDSAARAAQRAGWMAPSSPRRAHQVPDAQQDGAGADMAAQAAAVRVEPRPGRDHLHRSDARTSLRERRPRRSRLR